MDAVDTLYGAISASKNERSLKSLTKGWRLILGTQIELGMKNIKNHHAGKIRDRMKVEASRKAEGN
jgi:hypothetical protein